MRNLNRYNREFNTIDTEEKAYILGYFYGDGCITQQNNKRNGHIYLHYKVSILSKDKEIIDKLRNLYKFFNLSITKNKYYTLYLYNKDIYDDLQKWGLFERKSTENKHLLKIPNINDSLVPHFIRGLYDSDGGFYLYNTLLETFFCSSSLFFITEIKDWFYKHNVKLNLREHKREGLPMYFLRSKSNTAAILFFNLIYKDAKIFMKRKRDVFIQADMSDVSLKKSKYQSSIQSTSNQLFRLKRDYSNQIKKYKNIEEVEFPSVCCNYHTVQSGKSYKKGTIRPLFLCLNCGKRSVLNRVVLKQDELLEHP